MGSINISNFGKAFVQEQPGQSAAGNGIRVTASAGVSNAMDTKKEKIAEQFNKLLARITEKAGDGISYQTGKSDVIASTESGVSAAATSTPVGISDVQSGYDNYSRDRVKVQSADADISDEKKAAVEEAVSSYEKEVRDVLKATLGVTDEQITEAMQLLGLTAVDFANPNALAELTATLIPDGNTADMLLSGDFVQIMNEVRSLTLELSETLDLTPEELTLLTERELPEVSGEPQPVEQSGAQIPDDVPVLPEDVEIKTADIEKVPAEQVLEQPDVIANRPLEDEKPVEQLETGRVTEQPVLEEEQPVWTENAQEDRTTLASAEVAGTVQRTQKETEGTPETVPVVSDREVVTEQRRPVEATEEKNFDGRDAFKEEETEENAEEMFSGNHEETAEFAQDKSGTWQLGEGVIVHPQPDNIAMENIVPTAEEPVGYTAPVDVENVIRQVVEFARVHAEEQTTTLEMQLNPANLGKLYLEISAKEGTVSAHIYAQNEAVKDALIVQMAELRQNMSQAGIKVDAIEVAVSTHEFERNLEQQAKGEERQAEENEKAANRTRRINLNELDLAEGTEDLMPDDALVARIMMDRGNSIDFTA